MKTLKVANGDICFDETGQIKMVEESEEIAQTATMLLSIRKGEFEFDEYIGFERSYEGETGFDEEEITDDVTEALQPLLENEEITLTEIQCRLSHSERRLLVNLKMVKSIDDEIEVEGIGIDA